MQPPISRARYLKGAGSVLATSPDYPRILHGGTIGLSPEDIRALDLRFFTPRCAAAAARDDRCSVHWLGGRQPGDGAGRVLASVHHGGRWPMDCGTTNNSSSQRQQSAAAAKGFDAARIGCPAAQKPLRKLSRPPLLGREVANLHSFPASFRFPTAINLNQRYQQLGNSLSVAVVQELLEYLFAEPTGAMDN